MMSTVYAHILVDDVVEQGYTLGTVAVGDLTIFFQDQAPIQKMEEFRDELERQIGLLKAQRAQPVAAPADPPQPEVGHCGCPVDGPHGSGCPTMLGDIARASSPLPLPLEPYSVPADVLPQGQPVEDTITIGTPHGKDCTCAVCDVPF